MIPWNLSRSNGWLWWQKKSRFVPLKTKNGWKSFRRISDPKKAARIKKRNSNGIGFDVEICHQIVFQLLNKGWHCYNFLKELGSKFNECIAQLAFTIGIVKAINAYVGVLQFYWLPSLIIEHKELGSG